MRGSIFVNYRRDDSAPHALNVAQYLKKAFGAQRVFIDVDRLRAGENFKKVLEGRLDQCGLMLAVIGPSWLQAQDGHRRLDDPEDWVRLELSRALARGIPVVPVLVGGARLPRRDELPDGLKPLLDHHAIKVTTDGFRNEMAGLARDIKDLGSDRTNRMPWRSIAASIAILTVLLAGIGIGVLRAPSTAVDLFPADEAADWRLAQASGLIYGWQAYLKKWPTGQHREEANRLIAERRSNRQFRTFPGLKEGVTYAQFSPDGKSILTNSNFRVSRAERFTLYDFKSGIKTRAFGGTDSVRNAVFSRDGNSLTGYGYSGEITSWRLDDPTYLRTQHQEYKHIHQLELVPHSTLVVTANGDGNIRIRDAASDRELGVLTGHTAGAWNIAVSPDGRLAISGGDDGTLRVWDIANVRGIRELTVDGRRAHQGNSSGGSFSTDGRLFYSSGTDGIVRTWDVATGTQSRAPYQAHQGAAAARLMPEGRHLMTWNITGGDHLIKIWDARSSVELLRLAAHPDDIWTVSASPDGRMLVSGGKDEFVRLWDVSDLVDIAK